MYIQAPDFKEFYSESLGRAVCRALRPALRQMWPDVHGRKVIGFGYALPFLKPFAAEAAVVAALMPARQGAVFWSAQQPDPARLKPLPAAGHVALVEEAAWPIETNTVDRVLVIHGAAGFDSLDDVLSESWRVLTGQGRLVLVVPNRSGLWARFDTTPFGHGVPFSFAQIRQHLRDHLFIPEKNSTALFFPPSRSRLALAAAPLLERFGRRFCRAFGGVHIVEAGKQVYAGHPLPAGDKAPSPRYRIAVTPSSRVSQG